MKKIFLLLAFALFLKSRLCAQYSPAIKEMLKEVKEASFYDSTKVFSTGQETIAKATNTNDKGAVAEVYLYYGNYFYYTRNIKQAKIYLERAIITAKATHNKHIETLANIRLMFMEYESGLGEGVEKDFLALLEETKRTKDYENTVELLNLLGIINEEKNQLKEAARLYLEGLVFSESHNIAHYPAVFRNNLGLIKLYTDQTDDALRDFEKGLELTKKENDINLASHIKINMCLIYVSKNKINDALKIFSEVITYARTNNHPRELSSAFINLGSAFNNTNRHDMALSYIDSAINVLKDYRLHVELTKAYLEKADVLINLKNFSEARKTLALANDMSHKTGNLDDRATYLLFSHRLLTKAQYVGNVELQIKIHGCKDRYLIAPGRHLFGTYKAAEDEIPLNRTVSTVDLASNREGLASDAIAKVGALFNWNNFSEEQILTDMRQLQQRAT